MELLNTIHVPQPKHKKKEEKYKKNLINFWQSEKSIYFCSRLGLIEDKL